MKKSGEKMYSYVHFEKELSSNYHKRINSKKNAAEVGDVFIETCFKLLEKADIGVVQRDIKEIIFTPENEKKWEFNQTLNDKVREKFSNSDLGAIITRFADEAFKWHEHIIKRDEDREYVNFRQDDTINGN
jgi:hypothetical protein